MKWNQLKMGPKRFINYQVEDLAAGADIADRAIFIVPTGYKFIAEAVKIISQGTAAGIDDSNTAVVVVKNGSTAFATQTYNATTAFPADGSVTDVTVTQSTVAAGSAIKLSVTNGATANTPLFMVQIMGTLEKLAVQ